MANAQNKGDKTYPDEKQTAAELLAYLRQGACEEKYLLVHLFWGGCRKGCSAGNNLDDALSEFVHNNPQVLRADIPWRLKLETPSDAFYDYRTLQTSAYQLFREALVCKIQKHGAFDEVDVYSAPPWDRPHFPQVLMINGSQMDAAVIDRLISADSACELINAGNEPILAKEISTGPHQYRLDWTIRDTIAEVFPNGSVLIQLVNEHFYPAPDDDDNLKKAELLETLSCTIAGPGDRICFRYIRGPIVNGCDLIGSPQADYG